MLRWFEHSQVFQPYRSIKATGAALGRPWEDVFFVARDRTRLNGWFFPADTAGAARANVILFCHGNAGNLSHRLDSIEVLLRAGVNVFAFDYRGYGRSDGRPSESGTYQDALAAYRWLRQRGFDEDKILVWGESLGGAVATELAVSEPVGGLILQSTFTSIPAIAGELFPWLPVHLICTIRYDTLSKVGRFSHPVMVMHGQRDSVIGVHHGERLFAAASAPKLFCKLSGDHNDPWSDNAEEFLGGLRQFLQIVDRREPATR